MIHHRPIFFVVGLLLLVLAAVMLLPALIDIAVKSGEWQAFVISAVTTAFSGLLFIFAGRDRQFTLNVRDGFMLTLACWFVVSAYAALPLFLRGGMTFTDAFFESISGLTTTGSTVLTGLDKQPPGVLMWRALLQWIGGIGIIAMAIILLPFLRIGGMQLFHAESSDRSEKTLASPLALVLHIMWVYAGLTVACAIAYGLAGMSTFDAVTHAMTTLSTGGYSTHDTSFAFFHKPAIDWIGTVFMAAGGLPFVLYVRSLRGEWSGVVSDAQARGLLKIIAFFTLALALWQWLHVGETPLAALRHAAFNVTSIITTTGFVSADYGTWGTYAGGIFVVLTFAGGCTGSTAGAIKTFRLQILLIMLRSQIRRMLEPHSVLPRLYNGRRLPDDVVNSAVAFLGAYITVTAILALCLAAFGLDLETSFSGAATAIGNVGPGIGPIIGPSGNFATLPDGAKWLLSLGMLLGRLELFTVLVILTPAYWRN